MPTPRHQWSDQQPAASMGDSKMSSPVWLDGLHAEGTTFPTDAVDTADAQPVTATTQHQPRPQAHGDAHATLSGPTSVVARGRYSSGRACASLTRCTTRMATTSSTSFDTSGRCGRKRLYWCTTIDPWRQEQMGARQSVQCGQQSDGELSRLQGLHAELDDEDARVVQRPKTTRQQADVSPGVRSMPRRASSITTNS